MAKYFLTFVLVACIALENNSINKSFYVKSQTYTNNLRLKHHQYQNNNNNYRSHNYHNSDLKDSYSDNSDNNHNYLHNTEIDTNSKLNSLSNSHEFLPPLVSSLTQWDKKLNYRYDRNDNFLKSTLLHHNYNSNSNNNNNNNNNNNSNNNDNDSSDIDNNSEDNNNNGSDDDGSINIIGDDIIISQFSNGIEGTNFFDDIYNNNNNIKNNNNNNYDSDKDNNDNNNNNDNENSSTRTINSKISSSKIVSSSSSSSRNNNKNNNNENSNIPLTKCPKCESATHNLQISEENLTKLRIEYVKLQILEKLRLKSKPIVSAIGLPKPIYEGVIQQDDTNKSKDLDDYYARTSKKYIFMEQEKYECNQLNSNPTICFAFKIDDVIRSDIDTDVNTAVLWVYKKRSPKDLLQQTILVSEVVEQGENHKKYLPKVKPLAIQSVNVQEGWINFDIEWPIKQWVTRHDLNHLIQISCQSCEMDTPDGLISTDKEFRPFITIDTQNRRRNSRKKRNVNCTAGVTECCREKLYISFADIGWGDWIIQPSGYDAYFCRGSCSTVASIAQTTTQHSSMLRKLIVKNESNGKKPLELIPCCTAKQFSSMQLLFRDTNNTATLKTFPNMVIESCGCT